MNKKTLDDIKNLEGYQAKKSFLIRPTFGLDEVIMDNEGRILTRNYTFRTHTKISFMEDYFEQ